MEARELAPQLLDEYLSKLEEGQTLAQRPDLMQELGTKITPLLEQKAARMSGGMSSSSSPTTPPPSSTDDETTSSLSSKRW